MKIQSLKRRLPLTISLGLAIASPSLALPPPDDIPEEVLRPEIILEARSPIDGEPLTAAEYLEIEQALETRPFPPTLNPKLEQLIFLLKLRKMLKTFIPIPLPF
jgi:hypothetical protein